MDYTYSTDDESKIAGITAAREAYNAALPEARDEKGNVIDPRPGFINTDEGYVQHIMDNAAASYARQHKTDVSKIDDEIAALQATRAEIVAKAKPGK